MLLLRNENVFHFAPPALPIATPLSSLSHPHTHRYNVFPRCVPTGTGLTLANTNTHIANIIYCVIEIGITAIPVRFLHFYMAQLYATVYIIFTVIYWGAGGTGVDGEPYLYKTFDYGNKPLAAFLWYCAFVVFGFLLHFFAYTMAFVRGLIVLRYERRRNKIVPTVFVGAPVEAV